MNCTTSPAASEALLIKHQDILPSAPLIRTKMNTKSLDKLLSGLEKYGSTKYTLK